MKQIIEYSFAAIVLGIVFLIASLLPYLDQKLTSQMGFYLLTCGIGMPLVCLLFKKTGVI